VVRLLIASVLQQRMAWRRISMCLETARTASCVHIASCHLHAVPTRAIRGLHAQRDLITDDDALNGLCNLVADSSSTTPAVMMASSLTMLENETGYSEASANEDMNVGSHLCIMCISH
jgi:hypothetical protein